MACEFPQWCGRLDCELLYPYTLLLLLLLPLIFTARHYASAVCAVIVCPSAYPSVHRKPVSHRNDESNWFLAWELPSTDPTLFRKKILVPLKIRVLLSGTLSRTLDLENLPRQVDRVVNKACRRWSLLTTSTMVDVSWLFTTRRPAVSLYPHHFGLFWIC